MKRDTVRNALPFLVALTGVMVGISATGALDGLFPDDGVVGVVVRAPEEVVAVVENVATGVTDIVVDQKLPEFIPAPMVLETSDRSGPPIVIEGGFVIPEIFTLIGTAVIVGGSAKIILNVATMGWHRAVRPYLS